MIENKILQKKKIPAKIGLGEALFLPVVKAKNLFCNIFLCIFFVSGVFKILKLTFGLYYRQKKWKVFGGKKFYFKILFSIIHMNL